MTLSITDHAKRGTRNSATPTNNFTLFPTGAHQGLFACLITRSTVSEILSATYDGVAMTRLANRVDDFSTAAIFALAAAIPSTSKVLEWTADAAHLVEVSYAYVDGVAPQLFGGFDRDCDAGAFLVPSAQPSYQNANVAGVVVGAIDKDLAPDQPDIVAAAGHTTIYIDNASANAKTGATFLVGADGAIISIGESHGVATGGIFAGAFMEELPASPIPWAGPPVINLRDNRLRRHERMDNGRRA